MKRMPGTSSCSRLAPFFLLVLSLGCSGAADSPSEPGFPIEPEIELQSFQLVNSARRQEGLEPRLVLDPALSSIARSHSEAMREFGFVGHTGPGGDRLEDRLRGAGVRFTRAGENLARVVSIDPAASAHEQFMESSGHRANILDSEFVQGGVGVARSGDTFWITQVFIRP